MSTASNPKRVEQMEEFFDIRAAGYEEHMKKLKVFERFYKMVSNPIDNTEDAIRILDLGCGTGLELKGIFDKAPNAQIVGMDLSDKMLGVLRSTYTGKIGQITLMKDSYLTAPFPGEFNYVVSVMTMHHFLPDAKVPLYQKIRQCLKDGGRYIEGDYAVDCEKENVLLQEYHETVRTLGTPRDLYHLDIPFSVNTQRSLFRQAGFSQVDVTYHEDEAAVFVAY